MKLLLIVSIAIFVVAIPSFAQHSFPRLEVRAMPAKPDTSLKLIHADRLTMHNTPGGQLFVYEGNVEVVVLRYRVKADRLEHYPDPLRMIATGNVVVSSEGESQQAKRFEWKRSEPESPIFVRE